MKLKLEERREQILEAAVRCFVKRGFHQTTMQDISKAANISPALIYRHFESKEALIKALIESHEAEWLAKFESVRAANNFGLMLEWLFEKNDTGEKEEAVILLEVLAEALRNETIARLVRRDGEVLSGGLTDLIEQAQVAGQIDASLSATETAEILLALSDGLMMRLALTEEHDPNDYQVLRRTLMVLVNRFLRLPENKEQK